MDLQTKHMKENNRTCMAIGVVIQVLMLITAALYGADRFILPTVAMVVGIIVCILISTIGYLKLGQSHLAHYPILLSLAISYMLTLLGSFHTPYMYAFGTLIGIACIVYNDKRICAIASVTAIVENLIYIVIFYIVGAGAGLSNRFMVPTNFVFIIVYAIISFVVTRDNNRQTDEVMGDIKKRSEEQLKSAEEVKETAEKISVKLEEANDAMASLSEKVHSSTEAVEQISSSVSMTAEAIQTQTEMNSNIMNSLNNITEESKEMQNLSDGVKSHVGDGNVIITELQKQAEETAVINYQTAQMTEELVKSAETVKDIVSAILAISSQTNLLALNASIEAARAGEAGRGFAVVAEEIRKLSEDTKSSAEMISNTIDGLITSVHSASDNMQKSVDSSNKQGEMIKETGVKFGEILEAVNVLAKNVEEISANVEACAEATSTVMDSITDLSATSEQVAASSESSLTLSYECEKDMDATNSILADILRISRREA